MKSFIAYPFEFETLWFPSRNEKGRPEKLAGHYELLQKVSHLNGAIVKCGITAEEGFSRFAMFKEMILTKPGQKMIAFEKFQPLFEETVHANGDVMLKVKEQTSSSFNPQLQLAETGLTEEVEFVAGSVCDSIPDYLIENPELKIALLNIDLDEYDATITTLEFLYPRLMPGGILVIDNFHKCMSENKAVKDYFAPSEVTINNFSVSNGPHYIVKA